MTQTSDINQAVSILRQGGLVAIPTETVYGLGADATNEVAVRNIFRVKERPYDHPLIVHLAHIQQLKDWALDISPAAMQLAQAFWPGPLTLILKKQPHVLEVVTGNQDTIALRIPRHPIAQAVLQAFGGGIAAPSANKFTHISPTTASAVREELGMEVDLILDGGACEVGLESTIIDMSGIEPTILRPGMISAEAIFERLSRPIKLSSHQTTTLRAPGMHHLHYAPHTKTELINTKEISLLLPTLKTEDLPIVFLIYSDLSFIGNNTIRWVKMPKNAVHYAHDLYHTLRSLDAQNFKRIIIEAVPNNSEWDAIRDRLLKASA